MGYAVAAAAVIAGADVTLITGPVSLDAPRGVHLVKVTSAREMLRAVEVTWPDADMLFMVAAVADFVPKDPADHKLKKVDGTGSLALEPAPDILAHCGQVKRADQILVGFAVETRNELAEAQRKLQAKNLDLIVVNNPSTPGAGFDVDTNVVTLVSAESEESLPLLPKAKVANEILLRAQSLLLKVRESTDHK